MRQLTLIVTLIWLSHAVPPAPATSSLIQVTDHLSVIARLVNGIALQNGFSTNLTDFNDFIAELLDLESGDSVEKMMGIKIDVNTANGYLETILGGVKGLAKNPVGDSTKVKEAFQSLEKMKTKLDDLEAGADAGSTKTYEDAVAKLIPSSAFDIKFFEIAIFEKGAEKLNVISNTPSEASRTNIPHFENAFLGIQAVMTELGRDLEFLKLKANDKLKTLYEMKGKVDVLNPVLTILEVAKEYQKNTDVFSTLPSTMKTLKTDSDSLLPMASKHADFNYVSVSLQPILSELSAISIPRSVEKTLAAGFPNSGRDFDQIFKDLKSDWLKEKIAESKSLEKLEKSLATVRKWVPTLVKMDETRQKQSTFSNLGDLATRMVDQFKNISIEGETLSKSSNLADSIDTLSGAIGSLKPISKTPDFDGFTKVHAYAKDIDTKIRAIQKVFDDVVPKLTDDLLAVTSGISDVADATAKDDTQNAAVDGAKKIKALAKFDDLVGVVNTLVNGLKPYSGKSFTDLVKNPPELTSIKSVQESLQGTELVATLKKLEAQTYDSDSIDKMLSFGINIRKVQGSADDISFVKNSLSVIDQLKTDVAEVKKVMSSKPGSSRRRRKPSDSEALKKLEGSQTVASSIGRGVNLLRNLAQAHQKKSQLIAAADSDADVNTAIASVPKAQSSWTDDNRKGLKKMVDQLDGLEKYASENKDKELMVLGSVLQKASEIQGVPIDTKIYKDEVLPILKASGNQKVKDAVLVFQDVSDLELDYSKHSTTLQGALNSLSPIRDFFDDFFGIKRSADSAGGGDGAAAAAADAAAKAQREKEDLIVYIIIGAAGVFMFGGASFVSIFCCLRWRRQAAYRKALRDPERWNLLLFHHENACTIHNTHDLKVREYVRTGNFPAFKTSIKNGYYVDARTQHVDNADTLLHECVRYNQLKFAKYLIEQGADLWLKNHEYETPIMTAKNLKKKKFVELFKKYGKKKVYQKVVPDLLARSMHRFDIDTDIEDKQYGKLKFLEKFSSKHRARGRHETSHFIVVTDTDNCLNIEERHLRWVFSPTMLMNHHWMKACLDDPENLVHNKKWRVAGLKYKGEFYSTLFQIKDAINRRKVPYLLGAKVIPLSPGEWKDVQFTCEDFLYAQTFPQPIIGIVTDNRRPYYHDELAHQLLFYKCDVGKRAAERFRSNPDKWSVFSLDEFIAFLLTFDAQTKKVDTNQSWVDPRILYQKKVEKEKKNKQKKKQQQKKKKPKKEETEMNSGASGPSGGPSTMTKTPTSKASTMTKKSVTNSNPTG